MNIENGLCFEVVCVSVFDFFFSHDFHVFYFLNIYDSCKMLTFTTMAHNVQNNYMQTKERAKGKQKRQ